MSVGMAGAAASVGNFAPSRSSAAVIGFAAAALVQVFLIFTHSPWFDETQALLIARAPWGELFHNLKYEGHPALWYLWLGAVDRLVGGTAASLDWAQAPITLGIMALIWFRAPFPTAAKALLSVNYYFAFEYTVLSREYGLAVLMLLLAVDRRRTIWGWVCLALATNTDVYAMFAALALAPVFFNERRSLVGPLVLALGVVAAGLSVFPTAPDLVPTSAIPHVLPDKLRAAGMQLETLLYPNAPTIPYHWQYTLVGWPFQLLALAALPFGLAVVRDLWLRIGYAALYGLILAMALVVYGVFQRHVGFLAVFLIAGTWIEADRGAALPRLLWAWLWVAATCWLPPAALSQVQPFTHARVIAAWIRGHGLAGQTWGAWPGRDGVMLSAELGVPTVNLEKGCRDTFIRWDYPHEGVTDPLGHLRASGVRYVISEVPLPGGVELARFGATDYAEYPEWLYRFEGDGHVLPMCR